MNPDEYRVMYEVEDSHWWYVGLRAVLKDSWLRYMDGKAAQVLDVGCGTGATLSAMARVAECVGIDVAEVAVGFCRRRGQIRTAVASAEALPFPAENFHAVVSLDVLCHRAVVNKRLPLEEIHRTLKPGGVFFLNLPAYQWLLASHDTAVHTNRRFTRNETVALLQTCGFEILSATYWNTLMFPLVALVRLLGKRRPRKGSDLARGAPKVVGRLLAVVVAVERWFMRLSPLPFGLSVFVVARKR